MDRISQLHDEILLRILSFLPTIDVLDTMLLSKRWQFLWQIVPSLTFDYSLENLSYQEFSRYVERYLLLHEAPTLNALRIKLGESCASEGDIQVWIKAAEKLSLSELLIETDAKPQVELPRSLSRCFKTLVTLKLRNTALVDDEASPVSFPCLKKLSLESVKYPGDLFAAKLLSSCPILEDLVVEICPSDNVSVFTFSLLHLKSLVLRTSGELCEGEAHGYVIDAPSLECLKIFDTWDGFCVIGNNMSQLVKANVCFTRPYTEQLMSSLTSAKRLYLCLHTSKNSCYVGSVFHRLTHLKMCTCETDWLIVLMRMLNNSPNLRSLTFQLWCDKNALRPSWSEPSSVPECLLRSLETLEWEEYEGTKEEKEVVAFFLKKGLCLEEVVIKPISTSRKKRKMIKALAFLPRSSPTCRIKFG